jgi:hypothetical protein
MKRFLKSVLKSLWAWTAPVRCPLMHKVDHHLARLVAETVGPYTTRLEGPIERIEASVNVGRHVVEHQNADANLLLDGLVREIARLQMQIEALRESIEAAEAQRSLSIVGEENRRAG